MALTKGKLGKFIELHDYRNNELKYGVDYVRGVNTSKQMMPTKADLTTRDLSKFQIVDTEEFVFNHRTSRNGSKFSIAFNDTGKVIICTEDYVVLRISEYGRKFIVPEWLYMFFNRPEFDRFVITNSWGSSTEFYNWEDICDVDMVLPSLSVQQKYVNIYNAMLENQRCYERGLEDLKLTCDAYIEDLRRKIKPERIGNYLLESDKRNDIGLTVSAVRGLATSKQMIDTKADMEGVSLNNYKVVLPKQIAYVPDTSRRGDKVSLGFNNTDETYLVSSISIVFGTKEDDLLSDYLMLFLTRSEFDRYARFNSWGSARETFNFEDMCDVKIPIPDIQVQRSIADIYNVYIERKKINERLKEQIKKICPVLIKGSLEEGEK